MIRLDLLEAITANNIRLIRTAIAQLVDRGLILFIAVDLRPCDQREAGDDDDDMTMTTMTVMTTMTMMTMTMTTIVITVMTMATFLRKYVVHVCSLTLT